MSDDLVLQARRVITVDPDRPEATAVAVRGSDGTIAAVGEPEECRRALPEAETLDLGDSVLMPGFVESHSHPITSGIATQPPAYWVAPWAGCPTWDDVVARFRQAHAESPPGQTLLFSGLDRLLHGCAAPRRGRARRHLRRSTGGGGRQLRPRRLRHHGHARQARMDG